MASDWYPTRLSDRIPFHNTFAAQATATGTTHNLTAGNVTQAGLDRDITEIVINYDDALRSYVEAFTAFRDSVLDGDPNAAFPDPPTVPTLTIPEEAFLPGVRSRTRQFANQIKGAANYTQAVGEDYGIVAPAPGEPAVPAISKATVLVDFDVALKLFKAGYAAVAVDLRRGGGAWVPIGVSLTATFVDETAPLAAGVPEVREYRVQGLEGNARVGDLSAVVSAVAAP